MKSFFDLFLSSAKELKSLRNLAAAGMLLAMAVAVRSLSVEITPDVRIVFTCLPLCLTGLLYGPAVCGMSAFALDLIGFMIDNKSARGYSPELAVLQILIGVIYGLFLYRQNMTKPGAKDLLRIALARLTVIVLCNICIRSLLLYTLYTNRSFSIFGATREMWDAFFLSASPRAVKNIAQYPLDVVLLCTCIPAAQKAYLRVRSEFSRGEKKISER